MAQQEGVMIGLSPHHNAVGVANVLFALLHGLDPTVDGDHQVGALLLQAIHVLVPQRRYVTIILGGKPVKPSFPSMNMKDLTTGFRLALHKL